MTFMSMIKNIPSLLRWRLKAIRYLGKLINYIKRAKLKTSNLEKSLIEVNPIEDELVRNYFVKLDSLNVPKVNLSELKGTKGKQAFVDVSEKYWAEFKPVILNLLEDDLISETIVKYFNGKPWLWNMALNYSEPRDEQIGSQLWHFDYGDTKQLHIMVYFSEVDNQAGPFTFLKFNISSKIKRSILFIERLTDKHLLENYNIKLQDTVVRLTGKQGEAYLADPGKLLHQGARGTKPRLVAFITFTSTAPMSLGANNSNTNSQRNDLFNAYKKGENNNIFKRDFFF